MTLSPQPSALGAPVWEFWIDVGGTFTDCIARSPSDELIAVKILSSGITKGQVLTVLDDIRFSDFTRRDDPSEFWVGCELRFLDDAGTVIHTSQVSDFENSTGTLTLTQPLPELITSGTRYELASGEEAPILAIRRVLGLRLDQQIPEVSVKLGTTRGTNALLERKGAKTAFITTRGFRDVLLIGNQDRPRLFDLEIRKPQPLFEQTVEIDERLDADGNVLTAPNEAQIREQLITLNQTGVESIAICLLHSFANASHEKIVERIAREVGFSEISTSCRLSPLIKIVSRGDTTVMDAYLNPILRDYVKKLRQSISGAELRVECRESRAGKRETEKYIVFKGLEDAIHSAACKKFGDEIEIVVSIDHATGEAEVTVDGRSLQPDEIDMLLGDMSAQRVKQIMVKKIRKAEKEFSTLDSQPSTLKIMTSAGGLVDADRFVGKDSILSGPAGGVIGFSRVAQHAGFQKSIGFDMGGTSTDVSRFDGSYELEYETQKAGVRVVAPMLAIETVAAGGGSVCQFDGVKLAVGPDSAGADPGPACYGRGGPLAVTDLNLFLGKILPSRFPFSLDQHAVEDRLQILCDQIAESPLGKRYTPLELAEGFLQIANANMVRAIRNISVAKGYDPAEYVLVTFGGAGAQHACAIARLLGIHEILIHPFAGILSAYGIGLADVRRFGERAVLKGFSPETLHGLESEFCELESTIHEQVLAEGIPPERIRPPIRSLDMRYAGVEATINVACPDDENYEKLYETLHEQLYGYKHTGRPIEITAARVEVVGSMADPPTRRETLSQRNSEPSEITQTWFGGVSYETAVYLREQLHAGDEFFGPAILCEPTSTVVIDLGFSATVTERGEILISDQESGVRRQGSGDRRQRNANSFSRESKTSAQSFDSQLSTLDHSTADPVMLEIFNNLFASIAEQMGITLQRTSFSTNVKERLDFSCAIFSPTGDLVVNAPHIPVHLGAMSETVKRVIADNPDMAPGDVFITNDPYRGGSHLPDVTVITPVHHAESAEILFFTASRAHHAEIGGIVPGSMPPFSKNLGEEGVLIRNFKLVDRGEFRESELQKLLLSGEYPTRSISDNLSDISAQVAANNNGVKQLVELVERYSLSVVQAYMGHIQRAAAEKMRMALAAIPDGTYSRTDSLDNGAPICVTISIQGDSAQVDFTGTGPVLDSNLNANRAIVTAAVLYVFRCLIREDIPLNGGVLEPVEIILPECLLNPPEHEDPAQCAAVVGGNVETSQRVVDTLLGALEVAAASQGTMNNLTFGDETFGYYETICGGSGATPDAKGTSAVHTHMTNTRLTDTEVIERRYPVRVRQFSIRKGTGGAGVHPGGDGIVRELEFLKSLKVSMLSERRGPYFSFGLNDGKAGELGRNLLRRAGSDEIEDLGGKFAIEVEPGDVLIIETPGGGGYGK
jgi:5-oxoprolinase (ATP-hydrolysing)